MAASLSKTGGLAIALLLTNNAFALGLGEASGRAVLGQPLRLEIPLLGSDAAAPTCFRLRSPRAEVGNDFVARNARIEAVGSKLVVTSTAAVTEPVVGFLVEAACAGLSREYVLLVGLPVAPAPAPAPPVDTPRVAAPAAPATPAAPAPASAGEKTQAAPQDILRVSAPLTLEALAQQKYPLQPKAREKFMRMMMEANPGLVAIGTPIAAGTELLLPQGLPQRRVGPYLGEAKPAPKKAATEAQPASEAVAAPAAKPATKAGKDRLVLGKAPESSEAKLLAEAERLTNMLVEQTKAQEDMTASLEKMEADYTELRKQFLEMQTKLARIEAERAAERQAAAEAAKTSQLVELLAAVLGGGAVGGVGLHLFQRRRMQRKGDVEDDYAEQDDLPAPGEQSERPSLTEKPAAVPPWMTAKTTAPVQKETPSPAAMIAAVTGAAPAVVIEEIEAPLQEIEAPVQATGAVETPPQATTEEFDLHIASPVAGPPSDQVSAPDAAPVETPDDLVLPDVQAEPGPPVVLEALDFSSVAIEPEPPKAEPGQEMLTLDFPEITLPGKQ